MYMWLGRREEDNKAFVYSAEGFTKLYRLVKTRRRCQRPWTYIIPLKRALQNMGLTDVN